MAFTLDQVVPWGRSYDEYASMFGLTESDLSRRILGCGDGPAAFNSMLSHRGGYIVSVDPVYVFTVEQIRTRIAETYDKVMAQMRENQGDYLWQAILSIEQLGKLRMAAMEIFLADFEPGKQEGRYIAGELPLLPFENQQFDIALSSHFLFLYSNQLSFEFHLQAIQDMLRVAREVRIFPVLANDGEPSPHLEPIMNHFVTQAWSVELRRVPYEFQKGGNQMLVIRIA